MLRPVLEMMASMREAGATPRNGALNGNRWCIASDHKGALKNFISRRATLIDRLAHNAVRDNWRINYGGTEPAVTRKIPRASCNE